MFLRKHVTFSEADCPGADEHPVAATHLPPGFAPSTFLTPRPSAATAEKELGRTKHPDRRSRGSICKPHDSLNGRTPSLQTAHTSMCQNTRRDLIPAQQILQ